MPRSPWQAPGTPDILISMRFLKRLLPWFVIAAAFVVVVYIPDTGPERYTDLASLFSTERARQGNTGYAVAVIRDGAIVYKEAFGTDGAGKTLGLDTSMYLGPSSEVLTGALLYSMSLDGTLSMDDDVRSYLSWFPEVLRSRFSSTTGAESGPMNSLDGSVSLRILAAHAVGLNATQFASLETDIEGLEAGDLDAGLFWKSRNAPGGITRSRLAYRILGKVIERAGQADFSDLLMERILIPMGMHGTTADPGTLKEVATGSGLFFGLSFPYESRLPPVAAPADGIVSTAGDMARFLMYVSSPPRSGGIKTLPAKAVSALYQPILPGGGNGYGWRVSEQGGGRPVFQGGSIEGFSSRIVMWPERRAGIIILSSQGGAIQSNLVLPMLAGAAEKIMFEGSAPRLFPIARALALLAVGSIVYLASLCLQISGAFGWMRRLKDRCESSGSNWRPWFAVLRTAGGIVVRAGLLYAVPRTVGWLTGTRSSLPDLFAQEPGLSSVFVAACCLGALRNIARLTWIADSDLSLRRTGRGNRHN